MKPDLLARTSRLLGEESLEKLAKSRVCVIGLGGVGAQAAETLVRSGVGSLRLVDMDLLKPTDVNRHPWALASTMDRPKTEVAAERFEDINPDVKLECLRDFFHTDSADRLLAEPLDFVVDAIDGFNPKVALIEACISRALPLVSCMGAANRCDPTAVKVADISKTEGCPLARVVRRALRRRGIFSGVPCVFSDEPVLRTIATDDFGDEEAVFTRGRPRRVQPSMGAVPAVLGVVAAQYVVLELVGMRQRWMG